MMRQNCGKRLTGTTRYTSSVHPHRKAAFPVSLRSYHHDGHSAYSPELPVMYQPTQISHLHLFKSAVSAREVSPGVSLGEIQSRQLRLLDQLTHGCHDDDIGGGEKKLRRESILILMPKEQSIRSHDIHYHYRPDTDLFYLTGIKEPGSVAVFSTHETDGKRELGYQLFVKPKNPAREIWEGRQSGVVASRSFFDTGCDSIKFSCLPLSLDGIMSYIETTVENIARFPKNGGTDRQSNGDPSTKRLMPKIFFSIPEALQSNYPLFSVSKSNTQWWQKTSPETSGPAFPNLAKAIATLLVRKGYSFDDLQWRRLGIVDGKKESQSIFQEFDVCPSRISPTKVSNSDSVAPKASGIAQASRNLLWELRAQKSLPDLVMFLKSAEVTARMFIEGIKCSLLEGKGESDVFRVMQAEGMKRGGDDTMAYPPVVAGGDNATYLHYIANNQLLQEETMLLVDAGVDCHLYPTDCTRTWPILYQDSKQGIWNFNTFIAEAYRSVHYVQRSLLSQCKAGVNRKNLQKLSFQLFAQQLIRLGIVKQGDSNKDILHVVRALYPHGFGHPLGHDIHEKIPHTDTFQVGHLHTIEPGLYFPDLSKVKREQHFFMNRVGCGQDERNQGIWFSELLHLDPVTGNRTQQKIEVEGSNLEPRLRFDILERIPKELYGVGIRIEDNIFVTGEGGKSTTTSEEKSSKKEGYSASQIQQCIEEAGGWWLPENRPSFLNGLIGGPEELAIQAVEQGHLITTSLLPTEMDELQTLLFALRGKL